MRKAFFIWRHNSKGYDPMICYDEVPTYREPSVGPRIAKVYEINSKYMTSIDGSILNETWASFSKLSLEYPAPIDPVEPKVKI